MRARVHFQSRDKTIVSGNTNYTMVFVWVFSPTTFKAIDRFKDACSQLFLVTSNGNHHKWESGKTPHRQHLAPNQLGATTHLGDRFTAAMANLEEIDNFKKLVSAGKVWISKGLPACWGILFKFVNGLCAFGTQFFHKLNIYLYA